MADNNQFVQVQDLSLSGSGVTATATSVTLKEFKQIDGTTNVTMADFGDTGYATMEPDSIREENISFTGITQNASGTATLTGVTRGLKFVADYTQDTSLRQQHAGGTLVVISNSAPFYNELSGKDNDETITGKWTFPGGGTANAPVSGASYTAPTDDQEYAAKKYVDDTAVAGAPDANVTTKGNVEIATDAELASGAAAGSGDTSADLVAHAASHNETAAAAKVPVAESTGKLGQDWVGATTAGDIVQSDGTDLQRLAVTADQYVKGNAGGTAVEYGGANLEEANTFFGATDITGAEAENLTDTSNADSLHEHLQFPVGNRGINGATHYSFTVPISDEHLEATTCATTGHGSYVELASSDNTWQIQQQIGGAFGTASGDARAWGDDKELIWEAYLRVSDATPTGDLVWGLGVNNTFLGAYNGVTDKATFAMVTTTGALHATTGNGSSGTESTAITGITTTNWNLYRIEWDPTTDVKFYINNTLEATITTTLPDSASMFWGVGGTSVSDDATLGIPTISWEL